MSFADNLKKQRGSRGFTQAELAIACDRPFCWISNYETGRRGPSLKNIRLLRDVLECSYEDLLD